jgi:16S rRNA (cytosine967-C5)-methyltransferase
VAQRVGEQRQLLAEGARYVKPGGVLIYITCSILPEENQDQIGHFLSEAGEFERTDPKGLWEEQFPGAPSPYFSAAGLTLTPNATATDGFFISVLRKRR